MTIPVVDLADFVNGSPEQKSAFVQSLGQAYEDVGFVAVIMVFLPNLLPTYINTFNNSFLFLLKRKKNLRYLSLQGNADILHLEKNMRKAAMLPI